MRVRFLFPECSFRSREGIWNPYRLQEQRMGHSRGNPSGTARAFSAVPGHNQLECWHDEQWERKGSGPFAIVNESGLSSVPAINGTAPLIRACRARL